MAETIRGTGAPAGLEGEARTESPSEQDLRDRFDTLWAGARDGLWDWDTGTDHLRLSPHWKAILGYAPEELPDRDALAWHNEARYRG